MKTRSFVSCEFILIVELADRVTACSSLALAGGLRELMKWAQSSIKAFPGLNVIHFSSKAIVVGVHFQMR